MLLESDKDVHLLVSVDKPYGMHADDKSHTGMIISLGEDAVHASRRSELINMLPSHQHSDLTGRTVDFERDLRISLDDYSHVHEDRAIPNTFQSRTKEAIWVSSPSRLCRINAIAAAERQPVQANAEALFELENGVEVQMLPPH